MLVRRSLQRSLRQRHTRATCGFAGSRSGLAGAACSWPVLSTATFVGYVIGGPIGAVAATLGIFLPSFVFVAILNPVVTQLRRSAWTAAFLDGINVSAVGLMASVTVKLGQAALVDPQAWWTGLGTLRWRLNAAWLALGSGF